MRKEKEQFMNNIL